GEGTRLSEPGSGHRARRFAASTRETESAFVTSEMWITSPAAARTRKSCARPCGKRGRSVLLICRFSQKERIIAYRIYYQAEGLCKTVTMTEFADIANYYIRKCSL